MLHLFAELVQLLLPNFQIYFVLVGIFFMLLKIRIPNTLLDNVTYDNGEIHNFLSELHVFDQKFHELSHINGRSEIKHPKVLQLGPLVHRRFDAFAADFNLLILNVLVFAVIFIFIVFRLLILFLLLFVFFLLAFSFAGEVDLKIFERLKPLLGLDEHAPVAVLVISIID